jgi:selenocysteine lyase/cysteine desulfurase
MSKTVDALKMAREQFPITKDWIYFDIANMNSPPVCVTKALARYFAAIQKRGGDKSQWLTEVEATRRKAATLLDCDVEEIAFVKNTSEGLNIAANAIAWRAGDNVVIPAREHPNNVFPWLNLQRRGVEVRMVPETGTWIDADSLKPFVDERTRVVAVADVSFHPGQRNDIEGICALCREYGAHVIVDGVQAVGLLQVKLHEHGIVCGRLAGTRVCCRRTGLACSTAGKISYRKCCRSTARAPASYQVWPTTILYGRPTLSYATMRDGSRLGTSTILVFGR